MRLYVGGTAQGKLDYVLEKQSLSFTEVKVADGADCIYEELKNANVINHFHLWIKREWEKEQDVYVLIEQLLTDNPKVDIICDEVGAGIVPMKREEREYRELVGRVSCRLAKEALSVERIICGIGVRIK
ncbi:MAG: bifunctional adenosylcobinamide kinase/adenosylcobinamide-phosphate guanylyltransferase [bacterium]|nr:bifunctional adenosylcobinamide kinase/adenosylcobinamide-phosphate guanylyltransferase [bacterium]